MTATLAAMLVDEGKVSWDTRAADLLPDLAATLHAGHKDTTIALLLGHRAGLPGDVPDDVWAALWQPGEPVEQRRWFAREMLSRPPRFTPGARVTYSNSGYIIAGAILERVTGTSWETLMRKRLFEPLGMRSCGFGAPATPGRVDQPWGHSSGDGSSVPVPPGPMADNPPALGPAGTVHCNLDDWGKFLRLHLRGARGEATPLVTSANLRVVQTPGPDGVHAFGWLVAARPGAGGVALTHAGSNTMFYASTWLAPAKNRVFVVVTNQGGSVARTTVDRAFGPLFDTYAK